MVGKFLILSATPVFWTGHAIDGHEYADGDDVHPVLGEEGPVVFGLSVHLPLLLLEYKLLLVGKN